MKLQSLGEIQMNYIYTFRNGLLVPYSMGNITFNVLSPGPVSRPGHNDFYNTIELIEFVKAQKIRVKPGRPLLRPA